MGYRSDVRIVIHGPKELILREFASLRLSGDQAMHEALDEWVVADTNPIVYRPANAEESVEIPAAVAILGKGGVDWKWYPQYADVQAHEHIWQHFARMSDDPPESDALSSDAGFLAGAFVRIGEEDLDIESRYFGEGYDLAAPQRSIDCTYDDQDLQEIRPRLAESGT